MSFARLIARLDPDEKKRGDEFERLCKWYLTNAPEYRGRFKHVWLWQEWPGGGLRLSEALALRPSDVDWKRGIVHVRHGKGDESRRQPIDLAALNVIERWRKRRQTG